MPRSWWDRFTGMADDTLRSVTLQRTSLGQYEVRNARGGTMTIGVGDGTDFTPVELLLAALGGCTGADVDHIVSKRAEPDSFTVHVTGDKSGTRPAVTGWSTWPWSCASRFRRVPPATRPGRRCRARRGCRTTGSAPSRGRSRSALRSTPAPSRRSGAIICLCHRSSAGRCSCWPCLPVDRRAHN
jgi:hypothetical protein